MGTWGTAIFSDDTAADIRDEFKRLLGDGHSGEKATQILLSNWADQIEDPDEGPVFWLALAATQWRYGRLQQEVKDRVLEIIGSGADLNRWNDSRDLQKRQKVLEALRVRLLSAPPAARKVPKAFVNSTDWEMGEVIEYRLLSGSNILFRVIGYHSDAGGTCPVCELLDWVGTNPPADLHRLPVKKEQNKRGYSQFMVGGKLTRAIAARVTRPGWRSSPEQKPAGYTAFPWKYMDEMLKRIFNLR